MMRMMMKKYFLGLTLVAVLPMFAASVAHAKGSVEAGETKAAVCKSCHGEGGVKPILPEYPIIGGQHQDYLAAALKQYKSGKRKNASMNGFAAALSPQDILDLAAYFSSQPSELKMKY
jgi:cytochrome c553